MIDEQTVTLISVTTTTDAMGDSTSETLERAIHGCLFAPRTSTERIDSRLPAVITGAALYLPAGATDVCSDDMFVVGGQRYTVEGLPGTWGTAGIEVAVKRWEQT